MSTPPFEALTEALSRHQKFYVTTHVGPDGDAIGSALALKLGLESLGKEVVYVCRDGVPSSCRFLPCVEEVLAAPPSGFRPDCAIVLDCDGQPERVASPYEPIAGASFKILIDHHRSSEPIFDINWLDPAQPATALMIYAWLGQLDVALTPAMAECLLCGLSCDTGHFRFPSTNPATLAAASHLVAAGADPARVAFKLFDERSLASTQLLGLALRQLDSAHEGELVWTALSVADFSSIGTGDESSENVVNYLRNIRGCRMAFIFRERKDDTGSVIRISLRAEPSLRADLFCAEFGGGGHAAAAGCRQRGPMDQAVKEVIDRALLWLNEEHPPAVAVD